MIGDNKEGDNKEGDKEGDNTDGGTAAAINVQNKKTLPPSKWASEEEVLLKEWAEKAMCYKWLHTKSKQKYGKINMKVTIPVIILSTITGTANFAQSRLPESYQGGSAMVIGTMNLIAGIISTIAQYFKISELNEGHRIAALAWDKFSRNLKIQLSKKPMNRENASSLMRYAKDEFDRLMEISPTISDEIIIQFKETFKETYSLDRNEIIDKITATFETDDQVDKSKLLELFKYDELDRFIKPEICDRLQRIVIYKDTMDPVDTREIELLDIQTRNVQLYRSKFRESRGRSPTELELKNDTMNAEV